MIRNYGGDWNACDAYQIGKNGTYEIWILRDGVEDPDWPWIWQMVEKSPAGEIFGNGDTTIADLARYRELWDMRDLVSIALVDLTYAIEERSLYGHTVESQRHLGQIQDQAGRIERLPAVGVEDLNWTLKTTKSLLSEIEEKS